MPYKFVMERLFGQKWWKLHSACKVLVVELENLEHHSVDNQVDYNTRAIIYGNPFYRTWEREIWAGITLTFFTKIGHRTQSFISIDALERLALTLSIVKTTWKKTLMRQMYGKVWDFLLWAILDPHWEYFRVICSLRAIRLNIESMFYFFSPNVDVIKKISLPAQICCKARKAFRMSTIEL